MTLVFISHAAEDTALAVQLAQGLEDGGFPTWYYERDSLPGPSYLDQILHALDRSAAIVALASPAALASGQVDKEVVQAHERSLPFLPLLHSLTYEELRAQRPAWAMAFGAAVAVPLPADDVAAVLPQIVAGLRWLAGERTIVSPAMGTEGHPTAPRAPWFDHLPAPPTPLVGRDQAVAQLAALLRQPAVRLVTLTGPGGVGKTRLALAVAQAAREAFADGACFVDLAPLTDPALIPSAIAQALGIKEAGGQPLMETLRGALRERALLLVVDNVEQVVAAAPLLTDLLAGCPRLTVLATSRLPLHLRGEHEIVVPPLAVPNPAHLPDLEALAQVAAVALFVQRAQEARAGFALSAANAAAVAAICARLDGLPLAIELAAARVKLLPPPALLARLGNRLALLTGGARDLPERQRTLRATLDWSYDLLAPPEQTLFARLSVFADERTLEAIEAICNPQGDLDTLAGVEALLANSLLGQTEADEEVRFTMLETLHEYARERLEAHGETAALRARHAAYYLALAEEAEPRLRGPKQAQWLARLDREHDNLRAGLSWALESCEIEIGLRLAAALHWFWKVCGHLSEGRAWLETLLAQEDGQATDLAAVRTQALGAAGVLAFSQGDYANAVTLSEQSRALAVTRGDRRDVASALNTLGNVALDQGELDRAAERYEQSLALRRELGDQRDAAATLGNLGNVALDRGDRARAATLHEESLALFRRVGDKQGIAGQLNNLAAVAYYEGDYGRAGALYRESLELCRELNDRPSIAQMHYNLGEVAYTQGHFARAGGLYGESLTMFQALGDQFSLAHCLEGLARIAGSQDQPDRAVRLYAAAAALRESIGAPMTRDEWAAHDQEMAALRAALGDAFEAAWTAGQALPLERAIGEALHEPDVSAEPALMATGAAPHA